MAKRIKSKVASKSRKSALRIESLEQRQLLATITGGGTEVGSNIVHPNGNVYDQVLMTGSSVTIGSDAGQVTRVSYLDLNGDIVQAEFSGKGTLTVSLDSFGAAAAAANYNQPGVSYVSGLASFTIQGSDATTNFSVFSVGAGNAVNQALFTGGKTGGSNVADVSRLTIVSDPSNPGGFSNFGSIFAGNASFAADTGSVGISAANVNVQGTVRIGDINASNSAVPTLTFGTNSQFATLQVAGGDLVSANAAKVNNLGFTSVNFTAGSTSKVASGGTPDQPAQILTGAIGTLFNNVTAGTSGHLTTALTIDSTTSYDVTGKTQTDLNNAFNNRTFGSALTITGSLGAGLTITATSFANLTFTGDLVGSVRANSFGAISLTNISGIISTDADNDNVADTGEGSIGSVTVSGNITGDAQIEAIKDIGNVTVNGNIAAATGQGGATAATVPWFTAATALFAAGGNIGNVTVKGDVDFNDTNDALIALNKGVYGNVSIEGGGSLGNLTTVNNLGRIVVNDLLDGIAMGSYTAVDAVDVDFGGINIDLDGDAGADTGSSTLGAVSVTVNAGASNAGTRTDLNVSGKIGGSSATATVGSISLTTTNGTITAGSTIDGKSVGAVTISAGQNVTISDDVNSAGAVGAYSVTAGTAANTTGTITLADNKGIAATGTVASVALTANGNITLTANAGPNISAGNVGAITIGGSAKTATITFASDTATDANIVATGAGVNSLGAITLNGLVVGGTATFEIAAAAVGNVTIDAVTPAGTAGDATVQDFGIVANPTRTNGTAIAADTDESANANGSNIGNWKIGDITVSQAYSNSTPAAADVLFKGDNFFVATGSIGAIKVTGTSIDGDHTALFADNTASAVFVVGEADSNINEANAPDVAFTAGTSSIGSIDITAVGTAATVTNVGGDVATGQVWTGLNVLAGVVINTGATGAITNDGTAALNAADVPVEIGSGTYAGTVGNVIIKSYDGTLAVNQAVPVALGTFQATATNVYGGIFAKTSVGTLQGTSVSVNTQASGILVGPATASTLGSGNILVYVI